MGETTGPRSGDPSEETCRGITTWSRGRVELLRSFLEDHRSATFTLAAAMAFSMLWANLADGAYQTFWNTQVGVSVSSQISATAAGPCCPYRSGWAD